MFDLHHIGSSLGESVLRALFSPLLVCSVLLAPSAFGSSLQPGPYGSAPTDKSFILTFDASANMRSSYVVDTKGFYWPTSLQIGGFTASDPGDKGFSPAGVSANIFNSDGVNGGTGGNSAGVVGFFRSGGGQIGTGSVGGFNGLGESSGLGAGDRGPGLSGLLLNSELTGPGPDRGVSTSVSATPLPASWTMMLIGLLAFGLLAWFRRPATSENRPQTASFAAE